MTDENTELAAHELAQSLLEGELLIESAITKISGLIIAMGALKNAAGLTILHGRRALRQANDLSTLLIQAREKVGNLHHRLDMDQREIGLVPVAFGPVGKPWLEVALSSGEIPQLT